MAPATLTINSRRYGSWSLRGWLLCRFAGLAFELEVLPRDDIHASDELLLLSPSFKVPKLEHDGIVARGPLAIGEYLHETVPGAGLLPKDPVARSWCRSVAGEMHSGFAHLRSALPMNIGAHHPGFTVWAGARADIERIAQIWSQCLDAHGGPFLFGDRPGLADAMFAPVCSRYATYDVRLSADNERYRDAVLGLAHMQEWTEAAADEPNDLGDLDVEF